jgi:hypothetical protein
MRGQIGLGILKLLLDWFYIWALIDFVICLSKYGNYKDDFVFDDGKWANEKNNGLNLPFSGSDFL